MLGSSRRSELLLGCCRQLRRLLHVFVLSLPSTACAKPLVGGSCATNLRGTPGMSSLHPP
jgi:hypothetical protein